MQIVKPGTPIITKIGKVKAIVTGVCIREQSISYEISYYNGSAHHSNWIYRYEFDIDTQEKSNIGLKDFNTPNHNNETQYLITYESKS